MLKIKKNIKLLTILLTLSLSTCLFAANINCSTTNPEHNTSASGDIIIFGTNPPTEIVNLNEGKMKFSGTATGSTLYTNSFFTGKSIVSYTISNKSDYKLTVKLYKEGWNLALKTITINSGATLTSAFSGLTDDINYYLSFSAPSNFSGNVS